MFTKIEVLQRTLIFFSRHCLTVVVDSINAVVSATKRVAQYLVGTTRNRAKHANVSALFTQKASGQVSKPLSDNGLSNFALTFMSFSLSSLGLKAQSFVDP